MTTTLPPSTRRPAAAPGLREAGQGPAVVCLHANASSSSQWRGLMDRLSADHHVLAADTYGAGTSPAWPGPRPLTLSDEVALLEPVFARARSPFSLVGHSYGAALALVAAVQQPLRVRRLVLYEPTLFALLDQLTPPPNDADGIRNVAVQASVEVAAGQPETAARLFIDYWMGEGSWLRTPEPRRGPIVRSIAGIGGWASALLTEPTPARSLRTLDLPVLLMVGLQSPPSSLGVARHLAELLPRVKLVEFAQLGHMGPVTHPELVNAEIEAFLRS